ncbi:MAG: TVP38/TMEM64 family protein [Pseudomonadota bacterium]
MPRIVIFVVLIVSLASAAYFLPVVEWLSAAFAWIEENREISWLVFIAMYIAACVLLLPGSILTLGAGLLFGLGYGFAIVSFASVVGASCAFLVGRFLARDWVQGKLSAMPRFAALDAAIEQRGALIVLLTRLSPVFPFNLLNYALGLTGVKFWTFVGVSWIGMMPGTVLYVYFGSVASDLASLLSDGVGESTAGNVLLYVGLGATLVLTILITRFASRTLDEQLAAADTDSAGQTSDVTDSEATSKEGA